VTSLPAFGVIDVDCHVLEPAALWGDFVDGADRARVRDALWLAGERLTLAGREIPSHTGELGATVLPASIEELERALDVRGVDRALLVPERLLLGFPWIDDVRAQIALARAHNEWARSLVRAAPERLLPLALVPLAEAAAAEELARIAGCGFRAAWICPALDAHGASLGRHGARQLWRALLDAGLAAYIHPPLWCPPDLDRSYAGIAARVLASCGVGAAAGAAIGPAMDCAAFLMAILADGLLEELPELRLIFAHAGTAWLPLALEKTESALWLCHQETPVCLDPDQVFARGQHIVAFDALDGSLQRMPERFSRVGAWGSASAPADAPPVAAALRKAGVPAAGVPAFMGDNAARVLGLTSALSRSG
jgi:predicted TIM-barrel fold metal-dependent hydrolase